MTRLEFRNRLCILSSIDRHELVEAGIIGANDFTMWCLFASDPFRWFVLRDDEIAEKLWRLIERRAPPSEIDWSDNREATSALDAGLLPDGFTRDATGALVVPDEVAERRPRGSMVVIAMFDKVVTVSGKVLKDRNGALKAARAL